jgi:hypothetical protein
MSSKCPEFKVGSHSALVKWLSQELVVKKKLNASQA